MGNYLDFLALYGIGGAHPGGILLTKEIIYREDITEDMHILDLGCGTGQTAAFLKEMFGGHVAALENHPLMLEKARKRFLAEGAEVKLIEGSAENMPFENDTFDFIICESVLAFVDSPAALKEVVRVLKSGGIFYAVEMTAERLPSPEELKELTDFYGIRQLLTESEWKERVEEAGFLKVEAEKPDFPLITPDPVIEFDLSENIPEEIHEMLDQHEGYVEKYKELLSVRIIRCVK